MAGAGRLSAAQRAVLAGAAPCFPDADIVVALSGGADSAVCAWAAARLGRSIRAVSVDHGLPASPVLMDAAAAVAERLDVDHRVVAVPAAGNEGDLRELRYAALERSAASHEYLATGHTADDQAETVLAHLLRGSGAAGLAGIPARRGRWIRPLLEVGRREVRRVAAELELPAVDDPANEDRSALRNRIRHELLPSLRELVNPAVDEALVRLSRHLRADEAVLDARASTIPLRVGADQVSLPLAPLLSLPRAVASRVVRRGLRIPFDPYPGSRRDVDHVMAVAEGEAPALPLTGGWLVSRDPPWVVVHRPAEGGSPAPVALAVPGRVSFGGLTISAAPAHRPPRPVGRLRVDLQIPADLQLVVRGARSGDRIDIAGGSQPVVEALREAGVPARLRPGWPVVEAGGRMAWIAGARPARWAAARDPGGVIRLTLGDRG